MNDETCISCKFFHKEENGDLGFCKRKSPEVYWNSNINSPATVFPVLYKDDFCGEYCKGANNVN